MEQDWFLKSLPRDTIMQHIQSRRYKQQVTGVLCALKSSCEGKWISGLKEKGFTLLTYFIWQIIKTVPK